MPVITLDDLEPNPAPRSRPLSAMLLCASLAVVAASGLVAIATAVPPDQPCAAMQSEHERLACFDRQTGEKHQPPVKGAFAPS